MIIIFEMLKRIGADMLILGKVLDNEHGNLEDVEVVSRSFAFNSNVQAHDLARRSDESKEQEEESPSCLLAWSRFR